MKVVISTCFGGFGLSLTGEKWITENFPDRPEAVKDPWNFCMPEWRSHPALIACVEALGEKASGSYAALKVVEIPDGVEIELDEYDGIESIHEKHRVWG